MLAWDDPIAFITGLSAQQRRVLKTLEIGTVGELLSVFPRRYDDYSRLVPIAQIPDDTPVTIRATVADIKQAPTFRKRFVLIRATVEDETGSIGVTWFNQPWLLKQFKPGDAIYISGTVTRRPRFGRGFTSPICEPATEETVAAGAIAPVYPLTGSVTQKTLRKILHIVIDQVAYPEEWLPPALAAQARVPKLAEAYHDIHWPETAEKAEQARRRFAFGELLSYQLGLRLARHKADVGGAPAIAFDEAFAKKFSSSLPFELTDDQKKAIWACIKDMEATRPMRRLLQGDVGSGKTAVAAMLCAIVFRNGLSAALMAPTDLLAKQHAETFKRFLVPHGIPVLLVTSSSRMLFDGSEGKSLTTSEARERLAQGRVVAVGTHALLEQGQSPPDLALAVVDEQHRFGVAQREALTVQSRNDGIVPHLLSMSATPIPRSLALTLHGDLDVSIIASRPAGRQGVETRVYEGDAGRDQAYKIIRDEVAKGHRAFVVCPLIDPSDVSGAKSVEQEAKRLQFGPLNGIKIGMLHGKMPAKEKDERMREFVQGETQVLVATTVVEVGVDVPEATVILIEGAERFGLAQLHQLRGRVGRSSRKSYCLLIASDSEAETRRLKVLERTSDGFVVAEEDLKIRGAGNILGTQQSGRSIFKLLRMPDDVPLMAIARDGSAALLKEDPELKKYPTLLKIVTEMQETSHQE